MIELPIGLGVIGCGWAAGEIARAVTRLPSLRIVAACDADNERARAQRTAPPDSQPGLPKW